MLECGQSSDCLIMMHLGELCCPDCGGDAHRVDQIGILIPGAAVVTVGDPDGLAILEAGGRGEAHRLSVVVCGIVAPPEGGAPP